MNEIIKMKRLEKNMSLEEVGKLVGVGKSTVRKWENGMIENMGRDKIVALSKALDISPLDILGMSEKDLPKSSIETIYNQLEKPRQTKVYNFAEQQLEEQNSNVVHFPKKEKLPTIKNSASAANPTELVYGDTVVEEEEFERVPSSADFAVPIIGDSMEPVIRNGQFVFVKEQPDVEDGEIAIVEIDGDGVTCKEVFKDYENQSIILRSINELYEDRVISPEQIRIIGKVVF
ncbi:XRE family transcriptional regulator [Enterococcus avium]|uniref:XRE family transcriptional regulator n=1 Tax=Enterococcus avium TaxID=33945 RepID=A0AAW8RVI6_ENTAV|nr:XRE family transcriptional regulator [Enterococcus avium]MDT2404007.1 XRE family transcriptional regulator [Enterococcus avium]MDT2423023.1 XRE family transcriptional regulator [Enterococcus avium]